MWLIPVIDSPTGVIGAALGAFTNDSDSAEPAAFISAAGETPSYVLRFSNYTLAFDATHTNAIHTAGQTPVISWMYGTGSAPPNTTYTLTNLLAGNFDTYMTTYLNAVKALGYTVYVAWSAEMNGDWQQYSEGINGNTTGQYALAWKHVHDLAVSLGVTNIKWVWQPSSIYMTSTPLAGLYPGDAYVDVVAMSGYNWGATQPGGWVDPPALYNPTLAEIATLTTSKPIWIGEMGCCPDDGGSKTAWYDAFFAWLPTSLVSVFIYFEHAPSGAPNWKVDSGTGTAAAFTAGITSLRSGTSNIPNVTSLSLPGNVNTNSISTPGAGVVPTSGGIDVRFKGLMTNPNPTTKRYVTTDPDQSFLLSQPWDHSIMLEWHSNGWANYRSTVPHTLTMGTVGSIRAVMIPNGGGSQVLFYQSTDWDPIADTGTWTQVGTTVNATESSTLVATTGSICVGYSATAGSNPVTNVVYASVRPYGGAEVASFNPTAVTSTAVRTPTTYTDTHSNVWTVGGSTWSWVTTDAKGTGTGTTTFTGAATGKRITQGSATGTSTFTGAATGKRVPKATAVGTTTFTGTASGKRVPKGSASGISTFAGTASGVRTPKGSASGSSTFAGTASGQRVSLGSSTGTSTFTGVASGVRVSTGSGAGSVTFTGTATGTRAPKGAGTGTATWTGAAVGQRAPKGASTGVTTWTGTATGSAPAIGEASGSATGDTLWTGTATGTAPNIAGSSGSATGSTLWTGTATGATVQSGSCAGLTTWTGAATGVRASAGSAVGSTVWTGIASGTTPAISRDLTLTITGPAGHPMSTTNPTGYPMTTTNPTGHPLTTTGPRS